MFKSKWFCRVMGWHVEPKKLTFDGVNLVGRCLRCQKRVLGNTTGADWVETDYQP